MIEAWQHLQYNVFLYTKKKKRSYKQVESILIWSNRILFSFKVVMIFKKKSKIVKTLWLHCCLVLSDSKQILLWNQKTVLRKGENGPGQVISYRKCAWILRSSMWYLYVIWKIYRIVSEVTLNNLSFHYHHLISIHPRAIKYKNL